MCAFQVLLGFLVFLQDGTKLSDLNIGDFAKVTLKDKSVLYVQIESKEGENVTCFDLQSLKPKEINDSNVEAVRKENQNNAFEQKVGLENLIATEIRKDFADAIRPTRVAAIQQSNVLVTVNPKSGIGIGDYVFAYRVGEEIKDPETGEVLARPEQKIAKLEVLEATEKLITCRVTGDIAGELKVGDIVRPEKAKNSIAVFPISDERNQLPKFGVELNARITSSLSKAGLPVLERERIGSILKEQLLQTSDLVESGKMSRIGELLGAATVLSGRLTNVADEKNKVLLSLRLVDVRTGRIGWTFTRELRSNDLDLSASSDDFFSGGDDGAPMVQAHTEPKKSNVFYPIFDGKSLAGWEPWGPANAIANVQNGVLVVSGASPAKPSYIATTKSDIRNFHLRCEVKCTDNGNSGIFFHAAESPELHLKDSNKRPYEATIRDVNIGYLFSTENNKGIGYFDGVNTKPGDWYTLEVIVKDELIEIRVDGKQTGKHRDKASKLLPSGGRIAIEIAGGKAEFRKIELLEIE